MVRFESSYSPDELTERWDEYTSISRFAGCDDTMDLIFVSKRKGNRVRLVRKAQVAREPFSPVFRGKIQKTEKGSAVVGFFTKSVADYVAVGIVDVILLYIRSFVVERGDDLNTINSLIAIALAASLLLLLNYKPSKRRYADFISRITGKENNLYLSKSELEDRHNTH